MSEEELRQALHNELSNDDLRKLPEDFYIRIKGYLAQLQENIDSNSASELESLLKAKKQQVTRMRDVLIKIRLLKMFTNILKTQDLNILSEKRKLMTKEEKKLFSSIVDSTNKFWRETSIPHIQKDIAYKEAATTDVHEKQPRKTKKRLILVEILENLPQYYDNEGRLRGPHQAGDLIAISENIAYDILISKGKAQVIEISSEEENT